jgi:3-carboxy-cis,cis-muconate cycloisomerase
MDTASILQMQDGLQFIEKELKDMEKTLVKLATKHRDTYVLDRPSDFFSMAWADGRSMCRPMAGRTHLQQALPITFGYKCAVYLSSIERHLERLQELKDRTLLVQFGGAAGTLASLGPNGVGIHVRRQLALELGLSEPLITWHAARDNIAEIINFLALVGGSLGKMAFDIILMSSNEIGEVSEPFFSHRGASSTMPQKRNPISSETVLATSKILRANAGLGLDAMVCDFERASGPWHLEWAVIPDSFDVWCSASDQFCIGGFVRQRKRNGPESGQYQRINCRRGCDDGTRTINR